MKNKIINLIVAIICIIPTYSQDTISVEINLLKINNKTCELKLDLSKAKLNTKYLFPMTVQGSYEIRNYGQYNDHAFTIDNKGNILYVKKNKNAFILPKSTIQNLQYTSAQSMNPNGIFYPEDSYFADSVILLNWNVLLGYFHNTNNKYKIRIIKDAKFTASSAMTMNSINDTVDIFTANSYTDLIHCPVMYSIPDTSSFNSKGCLVNLSIYSTNPDYNSKFIKHQVKPIIDTFLSNSHYIPDSYTILCIIDDFKMSHALIALEHPNSTVICLPKIFKDTTIIATTIAHEFCHAIYTPFNIKSQTIEQFDYQNPICDQHLWFYEGCTEYIAQKISFRAGIIDTVQFIKYIHSCMLNMDNVNLLKVSKKVYSRKGQKYFMDFYTKGSLIAFLLDLELISKSNGKISLLGLMNKLQQRASKSGSFNSKDFFNYISELSGIDLTHFFYKYLKSNQEINLAENLKRINYRIETKQKSDSLRYTFSVSVLNYIYKNNQPLIMLKHSDINTQLGINKLIIEKIDDKAINTVSNYKLMFPQKETLKLSIWENGKTRNVQVKAKLIPNKSYKRIVERLRKQDSNISKVFWKM